MCSQRILILFEWPCYFPLYLIFVLFEYCSTSWHFFILFFYQQWTGCPHRVYNKSTNPFFLWKENIFLFFPFSCCTLLAAETAHLQKKPKPKVAAKESWVADWVCCLALPFCWFTCVCRCVHVLALTQTRVSTSWNVLPHLSGEFDQCGLHMVRLMINVYQGRSTPTQVSRHT